jgi:hypothetical protein
MNIKRFIIVFLLFKIICLTLKSDSCKKEEPIIIIEKITYNVQKGFYINGTLISMCKLNSSMRQSGNVFSTQITNNSDI